FCRSQISKQLLRSASPKRDRADCPAARHESLRGGPAADHRGEKVDDEEAIPRGAHGCALPGVRNSGPILVRDQVALEREISQEVRVDAIQQRRPQPKSAYDELRYP